MRIWYVRAPEDAKDEVASGLHGNLITQRLKLNGRVALVTGASGLLCKIRRIQSAELAVQMQNQVISKSHS